MDTTVVVLQDSKENELTLEFPSKVVAQCYPEGKEFNAAELLKAYVESLHIYQKSIGGGTLEKNGNYALTGLVFKTTYDDIAAVDIKETYRVKTVEINPIGFIG